MKHHILFTLISLLWLSSCSTSEDITPALTHQPHSITMRLALGVSSGMLGQNSSSRSIPTRAEETQANIQPRTLNTWEPAQQVNDMRIYIFRQEESKGKDGDYTFYIPQDLAEKGETYYAISDFANTTPYYSGNHDGKPEEHTYTFNPHLEDGYYYKFLAVGRDDQYTEDKKLAEPSFTPEVTTFSEASLTLTETAQQANQLACTELFTGKLQVNDQENGADDAILVTESDKLFSRTITLKRCVAGLMLYVENIPSEVEDNTTNDATPEIFTPTSLSLEATTISTEALLASRGAKTENSTLLYNKVLAYIDLSTENGWSNDTQNHLFTRNEDEEKGWKANSYMVGNFMMPTLESDMSNCPNYEKKPVTFYLHYTDGTHHRYDNIKLGSDAQAKLAFPILANHLYSIGQKDDTTNQPYDLKGHYQAEMVDITIEIEPSFEARHDFTVK